MARLFELAAAAGTGDRSAADELFALVYQDLKQLAGHFLSSSAPGQTLQPTALVHEAYLRLLGGQRDGALRSWENRPHFFAAAAKAMRHILLDAARRKGRIKHGGGQTQSIVDLERIAEPELAVDLLALNEALDTLAELRPDLAELVTLRYFGGLTMREIAEMQGISTRTADSRWAYARAWLQAEMKRK